MSQPCRAAVAAGSCCPGCRCCPGSDTWAAPAIGPASSSSSLCGPSSSTCDANIIINNCVYRKNEKCRNRVENNAFITFSIVGSYIGLKRRIMYNDLSGTHICLTPFSRETSSCVFLLYGYILFAPSIYMKKSSF